MNDYDLFRTILEFEKPRLGFAPINTTVVEYEIEPRPHVAAVNMPAVKSVIFNKEATIVYFEDGTKCIVRKSDHDEYNREHAVVYAIVKRAYGTVNEDGVVEGNGMGNMLAKVVANGYDQEAHDKAEKAKKVGKKYQNDSYDKQGRDKYGRFTKKANRK